jgi:hypothetical protein
VLGWNYITRAAWLRNSRRIGANKIRVRVTLRLQVAILAHCREVNAATSGVPFHRFETVPLDGRDRPKRGCRKTLDDTIGSDGITGTNFAHAYSIARQILGLQSLGPPADIDIRPGRINNFARELILPLVGADAPTSICPRAAITTCTITTLPYVRRSLIYLISFGLPI